MDSRLDTMTSHAALVLRDVAFDLGVGGAHSSWELALWASESSGDLSALGRAVLSDLVPPLGITPLYFPGTNRLSSPLSSKTLVSPWSFSRKSPSPTWLRSRTIIAGVVPGVSHFRCGFYVGIQFGTCFSSSRLCFYSGLWSASSF